MNTRDEQYLCNRVSTIDRAVGGLQNRVSEQEELIEKLTKRIDKLEGSVHFWFCHSELSKEELEQIALKQEWEEERDADNERGDF